MFESIDPTPPFDFLKMLRRPLSRLSRINAIDASVPSYSRVIRTQTRPLPITVIGSGTIEAPNLQVYVPDDASDEEITYLMQVLRHMFSVDVTLDEFYDTVSSNPVWARLIKDHYGLRPIQDSDLFESMVKVIIGQQLNVQFAATLVERLIDFHGETVTWEGNILPVFPSAENVATWSYADLRQLSFSQRKAEYVIDFAKSIVEQNVSLEQLWSLSDEDIYAYLTPLRGIGRWTVECFLLFGMGRKDVFPAADIGVLNATKLAYEMAKRPTESEMRMLADAWQPWRSYATYYLWQSLMK